MKLKIRTVLVNTTHLTGRERPIRLPYISRFSRTLPRAGDSITINGHLESMEMKGAHARALAADIAAQYLNVYHEISVDDGTTWTNLEQLAGAAGDLPARAPLPSPAAGSPTGYIPVVWISATERKARDARRR